METKFGWWNWWLILYENWKINRIGIIVESSSVESDHQLFKFIRSTKEPKTLEKNLWNLLKLSLLNWSESIEVVQWKKSITSKVCREIATTSATYAALEGNAGWQFRSQLKTMTTWCRSAARLQKACMKVLQEWRASWMQELQGPGQGEARIGTCETRVFCCACRP